MKQFSLILFSFFVLSLSAQNRVISGTNSIKLLKKEIKGNQVTFEIQNTSEQPFVAFDVKVNGKIKDKPIVSLTTLSDEFEREFHYSEPYITKHNTKQLNQDIHFQSSWSSELQFLPKKIYSISIKTENLGNKFEDIDFNFFYPNKTENIEKTDRSLALKAEKSIPCSCPIPAHESRADWDPAGTHPAQTSPSYTTVSHLVVHHAAGSNTSSDWSAVVRSIWNYHVNSNGWSDIGYNYLIDPNGIIYEGRGDNVQGAHAAGFNSGSMGVCLLGNYQPDASEDVDPSTTAINSLVELLSWKECDISQDPLLSSMHAPTSQVEMNISGHRDVGTTSTTCPGQNVYDILPNIRNSCASYMPNCAFSADADIIVSALGTDPNTVILGDNTDLEVAVGNSGTADVIESINVELKVDAVTVQNFTMDSIQSGEIKNFTFPNYIFSSIGNHQLCVYIDSATNETNSANNSYCTTVNVQDAVTLTSDLRVEIITISPNNAEVDELTTLSFDIKNIGDEETSEVVQGKIKIDGVTKQLFNIPVLLSNANYIKTFDYTFISEGSHTVCVEMNSPNNEDIVSNNSYCKSFQIEPLTISSIENLENVSAFNFFPNPTKDELNIDLTLKKKENVVLSLINVLGQKILSFEKTDLNITEKIDVRNIESGVYFLEINIGKDHIKSKIIIE